jgi:hypothetical protein
MHQVVVADFLKNSPMFWFSVLMHFLKTLLQMVILILQIHQVIFISTVSEIHMILYLPTRE